MIRLKNRITRERSTMKVRRRLLISLAVVSIFPFFSFKCQRYVEQTRADVSTTAPKASQGTVVCTDSVDSPVRS